MTLVFEELSLVLETVFVLLDTISIFCSENYFSKVFAFLKLVEYRFLWWVNGFSNGLIDVLVLLKDGFHEDWRIPLDRLILMIEMFLLKCVRNILARCVLFCFGFL